MADKGLELTARACETLPDGKYTDRATPGLHLIVRGATRAWALAYTSPTSGKRRGMGLGTLAEIGVAKARTLASAARDQVRLGVDPLEEKQRRRSAGAAAEVDQREAARIAARTLRRVAREYHEKVVEPTRSRKGAQQWINSIEQHLPKALLDRPIAEIRAKDLLDDLREIYREVPETGRRVRQRLGRVFDHAVLHEYTAGNPLLALTSALRDEGRPRGSFAALPYVEVPDLVARLRALPGTAARALEFAILTTARTGDILGMVWSEVSDDGATWTVPASRMKAKEEHVVYLSDAARAVLDRVRELHDKVVFPTASPSPRQRKQNDLTMSNMSMLALLDRLALRDRTTVHGVCRATFSTWANETGAARPDVIEACLAHGEQDKVRAAYNRAQFTEERKTLLARWAAFVGAPPAAPTRSADVIEMPRRSA